MSNRSKKNNKKNKKKNWNNEYVYHITPPDYWRKIKHSGGLVGTYKVDEEVYYSRGSEEGHLYVVDSSDKSEWDRIPYYLNFYRDLGDKFVVLGIKKTYLKSNGLEIMRDNYIVGSIGEKEIYYSTHKQIYLDNFKIPISVIHHVGSFGMISPKEYLQNEFKSWSDFYDVPVLEIRLLLKPFGTKWSDTVRDQYKDHWMVFDLRTIDQKSDETLHRLIDPFETHKRYTYENQLVLNDREPNRIYKKAS